MKKILTFLKEFSSDLDINQKILMIIFLIVSIMALSFWIIRFWYPVNILYPMGFNVLQFILMVIINWYNKKLLNKMIKNLNKDIEKINKDIEKFK